MSTVDKVSKITPGIDSKKNFHHPSGLNDNANNIHEKESKMVAVDIEKEYDVSEAKGEHH